MTDRRPLTAPDATTIVDNTATTRALSVIRQELKADAVVDPLSNCCLPQQQLLPVTLPTRTHRYSSRRKLTQTMTSCTIDILATVPSMTRQ